jgi:hypothetical protein
MESIGIKGTIDTFDVEERRREKQASRDEDARRLAAGEVTPLELLKENCPFYGLNLKPDIAGSIKHMAAKSDKEELELLNWCIKELILTAELEDLVECDNNVYPYPSNISSTISIVHKAKAEGFWYAIHLLEGWYQEESKELLLENPSPSSPIPA